ncbi:hypothetical protein BLNAU_1745 [Blattamonas nauphoetae]|uniref:Uncharacterized protein n=1 Tax=Blattamonas nauphoetae TaxID=2049346 RepID=A0ABQ9YHH8_9EUKA|nr:hypothetical protein BLNAU_1745 [Blattamonas nauphoetae]
MIYVNSSFSEDPSCGSNINPCATIHSAMGAVPDSDGIIILLTAITVNSQIDSSGVQITSLDSDQRQNFLVNIHDEVTQTGFIVYTTDKTHILSNINIIYSLTALSPPCMVSCTNGTLIVSSLTFKMSSAYMSLPCSFCVASNCTLSLFSVSATGITLNSSIILVKTESMISTLLENCTFSSLSLSVPAIYCSSSKLVQQNAQAYQLNITLSTFTNIMTIPQTSVSCGAVDSVRALISHCTFDGDNDDVSGTLSSSSVCAWETGMLLVENSFVELVSTTFQNSVLGGIVIVSSSVNMTNVTFSQNGVGVIPFSGSRRNIACLSESFLTLSTIKSDADKTSTGLWISGGHCAITHMNNSTEVVHLFTSTITNITMETSPDQSHCSLFITGTNFFPCDVKAVLGEMIEGHFVERGSFNAVLQQPSSLTALIPSEILTPNEWGVYIQFMNGTIVTNMKQLKSQDKASRGGTNNWWLVGVIVPCCLLIAAATVFIVVFLWETKRQEIKQDPATPPIEDDIGSIHDFET